MITLKRNIQSMENKYLLDANVLITAHRQWYPFDIVPSFWKQLVEGVADKVVIIKEVEDEILNGYKDDLQIWLNENIINFTSSKIPDNEVITAYRVIISSINENADYTSAAKTEFAGVADSWLCAYALAKKYTIVTLEKYNAGVRRKIYIPNICKILK